MAGLCGKCVSGSCRLTACLMLLVCLSLHAKNGTAAKQTDFRPSCSLERFSGCKYLQNNFVTDLLQDKDGIIWASTWNGILSYNGYEFAHFNLKSAEVQLLGNNRINEMALNADGNIYCFSNDNLVYLFNPHTGWFTNISEMAGLPVHFRAVHGFSLAKGVTWVTSKGNFCMRIDEKCLKEKDGRLEASDGCFMDFTGYFQCLDVFSVFQDRNGGEWILTDKGTFVLSDDTLHLDKVYRHHFVSDRFVWLATQDGQLDRFDASTRQQLPYDSEAVAGLLPGGTITFLSDIGQALSNDFKFAVVNPQVVLVLDEYGKIVQRYSLSRNGDRIGIPQKIFQDSFGDLWVSGTVPGIFRIEISGKSHHYPPLDKADEMEMSQKSNRPFFFEESQNNLWLVPRDGSLCYFDREGDCLRYHYTEPKNPHSIVSFPNRGQIRDHQGNWWFCSDLGLKKLSFNVRSYDLVPFPEDEFGVRGLMSDHLGRLWASTRSGAVRIFSSDMELTGYLSPDGSIVSNPVVFCPAVYAMMEDSRQRIWIATKWNGLFLLEKGKLQQFLHREEDPYSLVKNDVYSILEDSRQRIWVGCHGDKGLNLVEEMPNGDIRFINGNNLLKNYPDYVGNLVRSIAETPDGILLIGSTTGLLCFDGNFNAPEDIVFYSHTKEMGNLHSLSDNDVIGCSCHSDGQVFIATSCGGVNQVKDSRHLLSDNCQFLHPRQEEVQEMGNLSSIISDKEGRIWLFSNSSYASFSIGTSSFNSFESEAFLPEGTAFQENASLLLSSGKMAVGTNLGLFLFETDSIRKSFAAPPLHITDLSAGEKRIPVFDDSCETVFLPQERDITIHYSAIDFNHSGNISYAYRLQGLENDWHEVQGNRTASYFNLPAGHYRFQVKSTNGEGVWTDNTQELRFFRRPTFWESGWRYPAFALIILLFAGLIVGIPYTIIRLRRKWLMEAEERKALQAYCLMLLEKQKNQDGETGDKTDEQPRLSERDRTFMEDVKAYIEKNLDNTELVIDNLADEMGISRTILYRKTKSLFGLSPVMLVRHIRIVHATRLIDEGSLNFSEISYKCGFSNSNYFSTCFKEQTGMTPSEYRSRKQKTIF